MRFIDEATIEVTAGNGGDGCASFLREKFRPRGGPDGGNGGRGGDVIIVGSNRVATLADHSYLRHFKAGRGVHGQGSQKHGRAGEDKRVTVPVGTLIYDQETGELLADIVADGQEVIVAKGGRGGYGNLHFLSSTNRAPRRADPGNEGEKRTLRLELKLLAHVGLIGQPNAGKSSLVRAFSAARPKVADYPFTTLTPNLGVAQVPGGDPFTIADIPGLVEGAHQGSGLGLRFLKHVERTRLFVYVVDMSADDPYNDLSTIIGELTAYDPELGRRAGVVAANKMDLAQAAENFDEFAQRAQAEGMLVFPCSTLTGQGLKELLLQIAAMVESHDDGGETDDQA
ncbi:GTP-binding protein Obg/CgtA [Desulfarculus baarsii DSM 2075]|uniref:GTPase Obg n=1 Tax=Desulfarculus baarsii (strain ATCC 33931 / DSM 2075 / LMG 7858 / VKM B-1802 / 2st14) TaxID=644282 RepID=E1QJM0_DESB2|nr:GTPase ObgE [Desulfarculus baarsii]ADK85763.1 GTP-binding protein Obg/CgtA [Desulfarculus baarsii DSM 2075]